MRPIARSGLGGLGKIVAAHKRSAPRAQAPAKRAEHFGPRPLHLTDFSPRLRPFLSLRPENTIRDACTHHKRYFTVLDRYKMLGRGGPFNFEGVRLGDFVNEMARRAGKNNVYVQIHTEENNCYVFDVTVGVIMPVAIKGSMVRTEFTFKAQQQGFGYQLKLTECGLKDNPLAISANAARPDIGIVPAE